MKKSFAENTINFFNLLKEVFFDVRLLYRNFLHWCISKVILRVYGILLSIILTIPLVVLLGALLYIDPISWLDIYYKAIGGSIELDTIGLLLENFIFVLIEVIVVIFIFVVLMFGWAYSNILQIYVYKNYTDGKKLGYFKNMYFSWEKMRVYFRIVLWTLLYSIYPILGFVMFFIISTSIALAIFGSPGSLGEYVFAHQYNILSLSNILVFAFLALMFLYINYRIYFASMYLIDDFGRVKKVHSAKHYIKTSIETTKGGKKLIYFIGVSIVFSIAISLFSYPLGYVSAQKVMMEDYASYSSNTGTLEQEDEEVQMYYEELSLEYADISTEAFLEKYDSYVTMNFFLAIIYFFLTSGVMEMVVFSFFRHKILQ